MNLDGHYRFGRFLFWFAQIVGVTTIVVLILFIGGSIISELIAGVFDVSQDYMVLVVLLLEVLTMISYRISWRKKRRGPILILIFSTAICIIWGRETLTFVWMHTPILFSGLLLLIYSYYKEWILKRKA